MRSAAKKFLIEAQWDTHDDHSFAVPIVTPEQTESLCEIFREACRSEAALLSVLEKRTQEELAKRAAETARTLLCIISDAANPKLAVFCLVKVLGMDLHGGMSIPEGARHFGVSKQAIYQQMDRYRYELRLPYAIWKRTEAACLRNHLCNYRNIKTSAQRLLTLPDPES